MKIIINIWMLAGLLACWSCTNEEYLAEPSATGNEVRFASTLLESKIETRATTDPEIVPLPYINGIKVKKVETSASSVIADYHVKNGNKGTLEKGAKDGDANPEYIKWEDLDKDVDFYAWTTPAGVTFDGVADGTIYFVAGNTKTTNNNHTLNDKEVTPLEVFISAYNKAQYKVSPTVNLPFKHLVSKLSIRVRDWNDASVEATSITFYGVKNQWKIKQNAQQSLAVAEAESTTDLTLKFTDLDTETIGGNTYRLAYLPPLIKSFETDFNTAGDFCIVYDGNSYFGSLNTISGLSELQAGEHLRITMDLSKNFGVGVGVRIEPWKGPDGEETIYGRPHPGIYSLKEFNTVVAAINDGTVSNLPDSLIADKGTNPVIRLYSDIVIGKSGWTGIGTATKLFKGITFDGLGHTITLPDGAFGLFGIVGDDATTSPAVTTIRNLRIAGGTIRGTTGSLGVLAGTATNTTITNCHVIGGSVTNAGTAATDIAGGLIGTAGTGTTLTNCSVETTGTISGGTVGTVGALVGSLEAGASISNSFAVFAGVAGVSLVGGTTTTGITYSYCWNTSSSSMEGSFWTASGTTEIITFDADVFKTSVTVTDSDAIPLLDALNDAGNTTGIDWVYVYGKNYPVLRIEKISVP